MMAAVVLVFIGLVAVVSVVAPHWLQPKPRHDTYVVDNEGIRRFDKKSTLVEACSWHALRQVGVITTDEGPWVEDVYWVMVGGEDHGCAIPNGLIRPLLPHLQELPGFRNEALIVAMGCANNANFVIWDGAPGEAKLVADRLDEPMTLS